MRHPIWRGAYLVPGPNTFPSSTLTLGTLTEFDTPSLLDLRPFLGQLSGPSGHILRHAFEQIQFAVDNLQQTLRSASPGLSYLQIDAADIGSLFVGSEYGPGQLAIFGGPPSYAGAGWIGTALNATPINITSIATGTATTAADHNLKVNAAVLIEGAGGNDGYFVVDTVPTSVTFTVVDGFPVDTTGGTMTRLFQGGWLAQFACGGTMFEDAPFQVDVDGQLSITDALITLNGTGADIVLDPTAGTIVITEAGGGFRTEIADGYITIYDTTAIDDQILLQPGFIQMYRDGLAAITGSIMVDVHGYTGASEFGPTLSLAQARGTAASPSDTALGDTLGGLLMWGYDTGQTSEYCGAIRAVATQNFSAGHGSKLVFETTPDGTTSPTEAVAIGFLSGLASRTTLQITDSGGGAPILRLTPKSGSAASGGIISVEEATGPLRIYAGGATESARFIGLLAGFGGNTGPSYAVDATGQINASTGYRVGGTAGVSGSQAVGVSVTVGTNVIQYKDWAGLNQSMSVVTSVTLNTSARTYTGGIRTA